MDGHDGHSRFDAQSHERLITMVAAGNVAEIRQQGEMWRQAARSLAERSDELLRQLEGFSDSWSGTAAAQYQAMVAELADGIGEVAGVVALTRDLTFSTADCLAQAQARMPDMVPIPALTPQAQVFATAGDTRAWNSLSEGQQADLTTAWQTMSGDQQRKVAAEIKAYDQAVADADSARGRAIKVMNDLAAQYSVLHEALPELPRIAHAPPLPTTEDLALEVVDRLTEAGWPVAEGDRPGAGGPSAMVDPTTGQPIDWSAWTQVPVDDSHALFGDVYAVGSIAASAAVLGIGGLGVRWIADRREQEVREETAAALGQRPPWVGGLVPTPDGGFPSDDLPPADGVDGSDSADPAGDAARRSGVGAGTGALGGAALGSGIKGLSGLGGAPLGGSVPDPRVANPALTSGVAGAAGAEARMLSTLNAGAVASRGGMPMGGMMPMMPMTGAGEGAGGGRKAPWLLEREPVFGGESVPVIPPVIGGHEPAESPPRTAPGMTSGEWAPDEREAVLGRLIMLTALGAVVFRVMAMGGGLALLWWSHPDQRVGILAVILGFVGVNALVLSQIWGGIFRTRTMPLWALVLDALLMAGFALAVQQAVGSPPEGQLMATLVVCGVLGLWTACRGPWAGAVVMVSGLGLLYAAGWLTTSAIPWWLNVLAPVCSYVSAVVVVSAFRYILRDGVRATGEIERRRAHRVMHDTAIQTLEAIALTASTRRDADPVMRNIARMALSEVTRLRGEYLDHPAATDLELHAALAETVEIARARGLTVLLSVRDHSVATVHGPATAACVAAVGEALSNVLRHSGTDVAVVELSATPERINVLVADSGSGFDPAWVPDGFGIRESIRGRLAAVGGGAEIRTSPATGTEVVLWILDDPPTLVGPGRTSRRRGATPTR